jgi:hypothetical protein
MEMNCVERIKKKGIEGNFPGRHMTIGRVAHLTAPEEQTALVGQVASSVTVA